MFSGHSAAQEILKHFWKFTSSFIGPKIDNFERNLSLSPGPESSLVPPFKISLGGSAFSFPEVVGFLSYGSGFNPQSFFIILMVFCFVQNFFSDNTRVRILIFLAAQSQILFPEFNFRLYDKNSESDYVFFPPPKSEYFFQQHWESEYFFRKKT